MASGGSKEDLEVDREKTLVRVGGWELLKNGDKFLVLWYQSSGAWEILEQNTDRLSSSLLNGTLVQAVMIIKV